MKKVSLMLLLWGLVFGCPAKEPWTSHQQVQLQQEDRHPVLQPGSLVVYRNQAFVVDTKSGDVKIFKTDGSFVSVFGRQGPGPGEFVMPRFSTLSNNQLLIRDIRKKQLISYDLSEVPPRYAGSELNTMASNFFVPLADDLMLVGGSIYHENEFCSLVICERKTEKVQKKLVLFRDWIGVSSMMDIANKMRNEGVSPLAYFDLNDRYIFLCPAAQPTVFCIERSTNKWVKFGEKSKRFLFFTGDQALMNRLSSDQSGANQAAFLRLYSRISQIFQVFIMNDNHLGLVYSHYNTQRDALDMYLQIYEFSGKLLDEVRLLSAKADNYEAIVFHYQKDKKILWVLDTDESNDEGALINTLHAYSFFP